jgi:hypothetical protein
MGTEEPFAGRLESEKVNTLEQEGWSLTLDGTQYTKMWSDGTQSEVSFENVRDWSLEKLKGVLHTAVRKK